MSKQLKEEWQEKYNHKVDFGVEHDFNVVDFFYSLHLEHIKAIRESILKLNQDCPHDSMSHCKEMECYVHEDGGYNQAIRDVLLTIAE